MFSPEKNVGFFGGDADDFSYPRYNLDAAFFRVYENDEPYRPEHFLKWSENGASEDEFVLVSGHPARTDRYKSVAEWKFLRDVYYPRLIDKYRREEATYSLYKAIEEENKRSVENPRAFPTRRRRNDEATLQSLQAGSVMGAKIAAEEELRRLAKERGALDFSQGDPWEKLEEVFRERSETYLAGDLVDSLFELSGRALSRAETIVDLIEDASKPVDQRERYVDDDEIAAQRERLEVETRREFGAFDELRLSDALNALFVESRQVEGGRAIGGVVVPRASFDAIFAGVSPRARAGQIARDDKIFDKEFVASLLDGGIEALESSDDPAIQIALALRPIRERAEEAARLVEEAKAREYPRIDRARFAVYGAGGVAPNADFTLRLTYGAVADCLGNDGNVQRFSTSVRGAYDHASERGWESPFDLSPRWREAEKEGRAPMDSPLDFIATNDVTGGNSGSPAVNANGEVVGLIFDINFPMQAANYSFDPKRTRAVLVHSRAIVDLIRDVYQFPRLVDELGR